MLAANAVRLWRKLLVFAFRLIGGLRPARSRSEAHAGVAVGAEPGRGQTPPPASNGHNATTDIGAATRGFNGASGTNGLSGGHGYPGGNVGAIVLSIGALVPINNHCFIKHSGACAGLGARSQKMGYSPPRPHSVADVSPSYRLQCIGRLTRCRRLVDWPETALWEASRLASVGLNRLLGKWCQRPGMSVAQSPNRY